MKRQSQVFADHLDDAVTTRALEIERTLSRKFDEELEKERVKQKMQLAAMVGRMRGLDQSLKGLYREKSHRKCLLVDFVWGVFLCQVGTVKCHSFRSSQNVGQI
jgi:hypothetical protein